MMIVIVIVSGTMLRLCSCRIAWTPVDEGVETRQ